MVAAVADVVWPVVLAGGAALWVAIEAAGARLDRRRQRRWESIGRHRCR